MLETAIPALAEAGGAAAGKCVGSGILGTGWAATGRPMVPVYWPAISRRGIARAHRLFRSRTVEERVPVLLRILAGKLTG